MQFKRTVFTDILEIFLPLMMIEIIFHAAGFGIADIYTYIRIVLFNLGISVIISLLTVKVPHRIRKWIVFAIVLSIAIYGYAELEFKNFLDNYYSLSAVSDGAARVKDYILYFISDAKPSYYLTFISPLLMLIYNIRIEVTDRESVNIKDIIIELTGSICSFLLLYAIFNSGSGAVRISAVYSNFNNTEFLINRIGLNHFLARDIVNLFVENEPVIIETPSPSINSEETAGNTESVLVIDDSRWKEDIAKEENDKIRNIDNYLISKTINSDNEMTGIFEGYNMIYILVESFDYMAIDEELTPTLYYMMNNSLFFDNHYTPKFSCTTGESEFIAMTSLVPFNDVCTPNYVTDNSYPEALSQLFKNAGYSTSSFHNWYDQYYDRRGEHESWGIDNYYDVYDLDIKMIQGWQSDLELIEKAAPYFVDNQPFFSLIISSSMHWPYDSSSNLGDKYISEINHVYPDYPIEVKRYISKSMEFDRAMARLIEILKENGIYENTVITLFSDHHPLKLTTDTIREYSKLRDRYSEYGEDLTPFIVFNPEVTPDTYSNIMSTFDHVPTLANMFGLNYDSRLYTGTDVFSNEATVIFPNSDWITEEGLYKTSKSQFIGTADDKYVSNITSKVQNAFSVSYLIMNNDYFKYREYLADPVYEEIAVNKIDN